LKAKKVSALTFFGSTDFAGGAIGRYFYTAIASFGGKFDDGQGNMKLNTPENIAALTFMRDIMVKGYSPEVAFAGKFQEEEAFKDASAAAFPTGLFGYRYVNPLTSPKGTKYQTKTSKDMIDAIEAGEVKLAPFPAAAGKTPGCGTDYGTLMIPKGAKNVEGAQTYINWIMDPKNNVGFVIGPGGGLPTSAAAAKDPAFQTTFYKQGIPATSGLCTTWYGSLTNIPGAQKIIVDAIYKIIKGDQKSDIATVLTAAETEYNKNK
jgi:multiple sugar transport system substrate-binding protein